MYPFIYIASVMRTGSTMLQEALTQKGKSFIFHEPKFHTGKFQNKGIDAPRFVNEMGEGVINFKRLKIY